MYILVLIILTCLLFLEWAKTSWFLALGNLDSYGNDTIFILLKDCQRQQWKHNKAWSKNMRIINNFYLYFFILWFSSGCITYKRPYQGGWTQPLQLYLNPGSLYGSRIEVVCEHKKSQERIVIFSKLCEIIALTLNNLGAIVIGEYAESDELAKSSEDKDFTVSLIEYPNDSDYGGWTLSLCIFSATFFPCVSDTSIKVSLNISNKGYEEFYTYGLNVRKIIGPAALVFYITRSINKKKKKYKQHNLSKLFIQEITNRIYSFDVKSHLGKGKLSL